MENFRTTVIDIIPTFVNLKDQIRRWNQKKLELGSKDDADLAAFLIEMMELWEEPLARVLEERRSYVVPESLLCQLTSFCGITCLDCGVSCVCDITRVGTSARMTWRCDLGHTLSMNDYLQSLDKTANEVTMSPQPSEIKMETSTPAAACISLLDTPMSMTCDILPIEETIVCETTDQVGDFQLESVTDKMEPIYQDEQFNYAKNETVFCIEDNQVQIKEECQPIEIKPHKAKPKNQQPKKSKRQKGSLSHKEERKPRLSEKVIKNSTVTIQQLEEVHKGLSMEDGKPFRCTTCGVNFSRESALKSHLMMTHAAEWCFNCEFCGDVFGSVQDCNRHRNAKHAESDKKPLGRSMNIEYTCSFCFETFSGSDHANYYEHLEECKELSTCCTLNIGSFGNDMEEDDSDLDDIPYFEDDEDEDEDYDEDEDLLNQEGVQNTKRAFPEEVYTMAEEFSTKNAETGVYTCNVTLCGFTQKNKHKFNLHVFKQHCDIFPFECDICGSRHKLKLAYAKHMFNHGQPIGKVHKCGKCERTFIRAYLLKKHVEIIHEGKKVECSMCHRKVRSIVSLQRHMLIHSGDLPYVCTVCGKGFNQNSNLTVHMRVQHSGERRWMCNICGDTFTAAHSMRGHIRALHPQQAPATPPRQPGRGRPSREKPDGPQSDTLEVKNKHETEISQDGETAALSEELSKKQGSSKKNTSSVKEDESKSTLTQTPQSGISRNTRRLLRRKLEGKPSIPKTRKCENEKTGIGLNPNVDSSEVQSPVQSSEHDARSDLKKAKVVRRQSRDVPTAMGHSPKHEICSTTPNQSSRTDCRRSFRFAGNTKENGQI